MFSAYKGKWSKTRRKNFFWRSSFFKSVIWIILITFTSETLGFHSAAYAQSYLQSLPMPGTVVSLSASHAPVLMKGIKTYSDNPFRFDFFIDPGQEGTKAESINKESDKLIKYFLASLTVPEEQLWVNLSPYEKDRIMPSAFGVTEMGRDLLAQDYLLKQISASLLDPSTVRGEEFWKKIYAKITQLGINSGAINTFNKVWIIPETAEVYTKNGNAFVVDSHLKVMLEEDYLASRLENSGITPAEKNQYSSVVRDVIIPAIEKEVNEGENFAMLRQIYNAMILATWFKRHLRESLFSKVYVGQNKVAGVDVEDRNIKEKIYQQYLEAFKKGVFDFIREDYDATTDETIPRKYFAGGIAFTNFGSLTSSSVTSPYRENDDLLSLRKVNLRPANFLGKPFYRVSSVVINPQGVNWYNSMNAAMASNIPAGVSTPVQTNLSNAPVAGLMENLFSKASIRRGVGVTLSTVFLFAALGFSSQAQAAKFTNDDNRGMIVQIEKGDNLSTIVKTLQSQKKFNSDLSAAKLYGSGGALQTVAYALKIGNPNFITAGTTYVIPTQFLAHMDQVVSKSPAALAVSIPDQDVVSMSESISPEVIDRDSQWAKPPALAFSAPGKRFDFPEERLSNSVSPSNSHFLMENPIVPMTLLAILLATFGLSRKITASSNNKVVNLPRRPSQPVVNTAVVEPVVADAVRAATFEDNVDDFNVPQQVVQPPSEEEAVLNAEGLTQSIYDEVILGRNDIHNDFDVPSQELPLPPDAAELAAAEELDSDFGVPSDAVIPPSDAENQRAKEVLAKARESADAGSLSVFDTPALGASMGILGESKFYSNPWYRFFVTLIGWTTIIGLIWQFGIDPAMSWVIIGCGNWGIFARLTDSEIQEREARANRKSKPEDFLPKWMMTAIHRQLEILTLRGGESMGGTSFANLKGRAVAIIAKVLKVKRGEDLVKSWEKEFNRVLKSAIEKGAKPMPGSGIVSATGHVRLPTGGPSLLEAAHLFTTTDNLGKELFAMYRGQEGNFAVDNLWVLHDGEFDENTDASFITLGANGDNKFAHAFGETLDTTQIRDVYAAIYQHELGDAYQWVKIPDEYGKLPDPHRIVNGDSPPMALQVLERLTRGNWKASARYARNRTILKTVSEILDEANVMSLEEEDLINKNVIRDIFINHRLKLSRPGLNKKNKDFTDLWATKAMVEADPRWAPQFEALENFRTALLARFIALRDESVHAATAEGIIIRKWKHNENTDLAAYVELLVERFFVGDRETAVREFAEQAQGTFGVQVRDSQHPNEVTLFANEQGLSIGYSIKGGFVTFSSEHSSMMVKYGNAGEGGRGYLENIIFLESEAPGQIANIRVNETGRLFDLSVYSMKEKRQLNKEEILANGFPQTAENPYYRAPLEYQDPTNKSSEEIAMIAEGAARLHSQWEDLNSHLRQSGEAMLAKFASRDIEYYLKANSLVYGNMQGNIIRNLGVIIDNAMDTTTSNGRKIKSQIIHGIHNDSILPYMRDYVDRFIAQKADEISQSIISGEKTEDDLPDAQIEFDRLLQKRFNEELRRIIARIASHNFKFFEEWLAEAKAKGGVDGLIGAGEIDALQVGYESSRNLGLALNNLYKIIFPKMKTLEVSSNDALSLNGNKGVGYRTIAQVRSKSGATSPSKTSVPRLLKIMPDNVFASTNRPDTLIGLALGQKYLPNSKFSKRLFYTGDYFQSEAVSAGEVLLLVNDIEQAIYLAKRFRELYPTRQPFGMTMTMAEIQELERMRDDLLVAEAERLTGVSRKQEKQESLVHQTLVKKGQHVGKSILEGPANNFVFRAFVFAIFMFGAPIQNYFELWTGISVPPFEDLLGLTLRMLDFSLAVTFQWMFTAWAYRSFSERPRWARLTGLTLAVNDPSLLVSEANEMFAVKQGSMSIGSMHMHVLSSDPTDTTAAKLLPRIVRGALVLIGMPYDPEKQDQVSLTTQHVGAVKNGILGHSLKTGAEIFMFFRGKDDKIVPSAVQHKINLGAPDIQLATPKVLEFYENSFDMYGRLIAGKILIDEAYRYATTFKVGNKSFQLWDRAKTFFRTGVLSTSVPRMLSSKPVEVAGKDPFAQFPNIKSVPVVQVKSTLLSDGSSDQRQLVAENLAASNKQQGSGPSDNIAASSAVNAPGGIDLNPRSLKMNVISDTSSSAIMVPPDPDFILDPKVINAMPSDRFVPMIIEIVPVSSVDMFLGMADKNIDSQMAAVVQ